jgi:choline dehydrogenase-like flavoprotein
MATDRYDVVIIGTGAGGGTMAHALADSGARILLVERGTFVPHNNRGKRKSRTEFKKEEIVCMRENAR